MELGSTEREQLRQQIALLGKELVGLNTSKEALYKEKAALDSLLSTTIAAAKELKAKKADIDAEIKKKKLLRTELNKEIKELCAALAKARKASSKAKGQLSAEAIKAQIEAMQYAIETEGLPFAKEKAYMERIKRLRTELASAPVEAEFKNLHAELDAKKAVANRIHKEIQHLATQSTQCFEALTAKALAITRAKAAKTTIQAKLRELRAALEAKNAELGATLSQRLSSSAPTVSAEALEVECINKFKMAKKLTKDDLLKLQRLTAKKNDQQKDLSSTI